MKLSDSDRDDFVPKIYDRMSHDGQKVPPEFNAVRLCIEASLGSDVNWKQSELDAQMFIEQGLKIFWEINLGLFSRLSYPMDQVYQVKSLKERIERFHNTLWREFEQDSLGLCIYRGSADFTIDFPWAKISRECNHHANLLVWLEQTFHDVATFNREVGFAIDSFDQLNYRILLQRPLGKHLLNIFCRNVCLDYLSILYRSLGPDPAIPLFVMIDPFPIKNLASLALTLSRECFQDYHLIVRGNPLPLAHICWEKGEYATEGYISCSAVPSASARVGNVAICLPSSPLKLSCSFEDLETVLKEVKMRAMTYRLIPEALLTMEWEGLDFLIFFPEGLSDLGQRKLLGFCAAGGTVVTSGQKIGFPQELTFDEWTEKLLEIL